MAVIDPQNGHFQIPGKVLLAPETTLNDFETAFGNGSFQSRLPENSDDLEEHFSTTKFRIGEERYVFNFFFRRHKLTFVHFHVEPFDQEKPGPEAETYAYYE